MTTCVAVVRIRGTVNVPKDIRDTLKMLNLTRVNRATLVEPTPPILGMLRKAKDYIIWGEINRETLIELLKTRCEVKGGRKLDTDILKKLGFNSIEEFADSLLNAKVKLDRFKRIIKPFFRLHPPKGGFKRSVKKPFSAGGILGYVGDKINDIISRMI